VSSPPRGISRCLAAAGVGAQGSGPVPGQPDHARPCDHADLRPVHLRLGECAGGGEGGTGAVREVPRRRRLGDRPRADGHREPQPVDAGEGEHEEPRPRSPAHHRWREGPHGAVGWRERRLQAPEAQPRRDGDREDAEPRPLAHDRPRLAGGRAGPLPLRSSSAPPAASRSPTFPGCRWSPRSPWGWRHDRSHAEAAHDRRPAGHPVPRVRRLPGHPADDRGRGRRLPDGELADAGDAPKPRADDDGPHREAERLPARVRANSGPQPWIVGSTAPRPTRNAARAAAAISASSPTTLPTRVAAISPAMSSTFTP
jgi:hypothetical protein